VADRINATQKVHFFNFFFSTKHFFLFLNLEIKQQTIDHVELSIQQFNNL